MVLILIQHDPIVSALHHSQVLAVAGVHTFSMNSGLTTEDFGWGSKNFHKMVCTLQSCIVITFSYATN